MDGRGSPAESSEVWEETRCARGWPENACAERDKG
jgi:hypothetical protein